MSFTNAQLAQQIADLITYWSSFNEEYSDWLGGTVDGGPGADGKYPLTNWAGAESLVDSPAKLADNVSGYVGLASASEAAAAASAAAASTSESNAAASEAQATSDAAAAAASAAAAAVDEGLASSSATVSTAQANLATDRASYAQEWANKAEDSLVSVAAGGDNVDDYSAMHHATKASASAAAALVSETNAAASEAAAATFNPVLYAALADNETITGSWTFGADFFLGDVRFRQVDSVIYPQTNDGATLGGGTNRFAAGYFTTLLAQTHLNMQTGEAIEDIADGWLRLNNNQSFSNGVYTPGNLRVESAFNVAGAATFEGYVNGALKVYESRQAAGLSLDTLLVDGVYHMHNATGAGHPTGDTLAYGNLMVFDNSDVHTQVYFSRHNDGRIYTRSKSTGAGDFTGTAWNRLWSDADFDFADYALLAGGNTFSGVQTFGGGIQVDGLVDNDVMIDFNMDRPWRFMSQGEDASNKLELQSINDKNFLITDSVGATQFTFDTNVGTFTAVGSVDAQGLNINGNADVIGSFDVLDAANGNTHFNYTGGQNYISHLNTGWTRFRSFDGVSTYTTHLELDSGGLTLFGVDGTSYNLELQGIAPTIKLSDTDASADDFWIHVNSNNFYVLRDNNDDNSWDSPHPLQLEADTNLAYIFGKQVTLHGETHYTNGSNGLGAVTGTYGAVQTVGSSGGYGGISLDGNFALMNSGAAHVGLYDDINDAWFMLCYPNSYIRLYHNGDYKLTTESTGIQVIGVGEFTGGTDIPTSFANQNVIGSPNGSLGNDILHVGYQVKGGSYDATTGSLTGYCRIRFPVATTNDSCMMTMMIHGYNYSGTDGTVDGGHWCIAVSGYFYSTENWHNTSARIVTGSPPFDIVRFGEDETGDYKYILLGESTTQWDYPKVWLTDLTGGHSTQYTDWLNGTWLIDISASLPSNYSDDSTASDYNVGGQIRWDGEDSNNADTKNLGGRVRITTASPTGGQNGDIWFKY